MFEAWKDTTWSKRGDDYEALKNEITDRIMEVVYDKLPHLRGAGLAKRIVVG